jgi:diadenosine tetraphosphate (Ap4A) HIT family hydrolase
MISEHAVALPHPHPITSCHVAVAPRRHVSTFYELDVEEQHFLWDMVGEIRKRITSALKVEGFDIGFEDAPPGGAGHALIHVLARSQGDFVRLPEGVQWVHD